VETGSNTIADTTTQSDKVLPQAASTLPKVSRAYHQCDMKPSTEYPYRFLFLWQVLYYLSFLSLVGLVLSGRLVIIGEEYRHTFGVDQEKVPIVTVNQACQVPRRGNMMIVTHHSHATFFGWKLIHHLDWMGGIDMLTPPAQKRCLSTTLCRITESKAGWSPHAIH